MFRIFQKEECKEHYEQENYSTPFNETDNWSTNSDEPTKFKGGKIIFSSLTNQD